VRDFNGAAAADARAALTIIRRRAFGAPLEGQRRHPAIPHLRLDLYTPTAHRAWRVTLLCGSFIL
jgi:hypothetical protein